MPSLSRSQSQDYESKTSTLEVPTNDESAFSWGNGFLLNALTSGGGLPDDTGTFGESMSDLGRGLSNSGAGTGNAWASAGGASTSHEWDSWYSGGMGMGYGAGLQGEHGGYSAGYGVGLGGGGGSWDRQTLDADGNVLREASGYGGGVGGSLRAQQSGNLFGQSASTSTELYRGVGGNAYQFSDPQTGRTGYGVDGNYTPFGLNNTNISADTSLGSGSLSAENMVYGRMNGSLEGYQTAEGGYGMQAAWSPGRTEVHGVEGNMSTALGDTNVSLGSFGTGPRYQAGFEANPDGSFMGNAGWAGGGFALKDGAYSHDFGNGASVNAGFGEINTADGWNANVGYDGNGNVVGNGELSTGNTVNNAYYNAGIEGGPSFGASLGHYSDGNNLKIDNASFGADGVHVAGSGHTGGFGIKDARVAGGMEGIYYNELNVGEASTRTTVEGASFDLDGSGMNAEMERLRTNGFRVNDISGRNDYLGTRTDYSVGEVSNDLLLEGARLSADGNGINGGFDELDFGGVRVKDVGIDSDLGVLGNANAGLGSFTNGNSFKGADFGIGPDGAHASLDSFGVAGMDIEDAHASYSGPMGAYADASLGRLHTGVAGTDVQANIGADGASLSAGSLTYDSYLLEDVALSGGIEGVYESQASLGKGHLHSAGADNLEIGLDGDGLGISAENARYSYLGVEDFSASTEYFGGAAGQSLELGRGDYLGGSADSIAYQTNLLNTSLAVEGLNAHGLQLEDLNAGAHIGDASANIGAEELDLLDLNVGSLEANSTNFGLAADARVEDARLDVINAKGVGGSLDWGETTVLGAQTDFSSGMGVEHAEAEYDILGGTASGRVENANINSMYDNTSVTVGGHTLDIGRTGVNANVSGGADVDLFGGTASGDVNFAGSELALFGHSLEVGDWAQASGGVDLSEGAVNANIGGDNGVGADINLSEGNFDINAFGYELDVDEGVEAVGSAITSGLSTAGDAIGDAWDWATSGW